MGLEKTSSLDPLIRTTDVAPTRRRFSFSRTFKSSWRTTVSCGAALAGAALIINITVLVWGTASSQKDGQALTLFEGSCDTAQNATLWIHLAINVVSTLLLGASNNCAQLLSSPTRSEIDRAHISGTWLEIGVPGLRNLRWINRWRRAIWCLLLVSSFPLHLLYNSAIYGATAANAYQVTLVTTEFLHGGWWDASRAANAIGLQDPGWFYGSFASHEKSIEPTRVMQKNVDQLVRLENTECLQIYTTKIQSAWGDVLVVTSLDRNDSVIQIWNHDPGFNDYGMEAHYNDQLWVCTGHVDYDLTASSCNIDALINNATHWTIKDVSQRGDRLPGASPSFAAPIEYCLATSTPSHCSVRLSTSIMWVVIMCNFIKLVCLLSTTYLRHFEPIATIGDAISSFSEHCDVVTSHTGFLSNKDGGTECRSRGHTWGSAVGSSRALLSLFVSLALWFVALTLLFVGFVPLEFNSRGYKLPSWKKISSVGFGTTSFSYIIGKTTHRSLLENIMLANSPQLGLSLVYVLYNNVLTYMVSAHEYTKFAKTRKPLRVSRPSGQQRTTFWLQLPYRYAVPILGSMAVLHWIISRSLFLFQLTVYGDNGTKIIDRKAWEPLSASERSYNSDIACGYSPLAIIYALIAGAVLILAVVAISFRKLTPGMPITASNSLSLSAAAATAYDEPGAALRPLQYGALHANWSRRDVQRVGLSSKEVTPVIYCEHDVIGKCVRVSDREYWMT